MKYPVSNTAFQNICREFSTSLSCMKTCSEATYITIEEIGEITDPDGFDEDDYIFDQPTGNSEKKSFIEGLVAHVYQIVMEAENKDNKDLIEILITNTIDRFESNYPIGGEESIPRGVVVSYPDFDSFYKDVDLDFIKRNVKRCWDRACITDQPFSEYELIELLKNEKVQQWAIDKGITDSVCRKVADKEAREDNEKQGMTK